MFEAASLSKPLFAYIVLSLSERGEIDLDKPLYTILSSYKGIETDPRYMKLTARLVLSHRTGLPNWGKAPLEFQFTPDEGFGYSGEGFVYLQKVMEKITGKKLEEIAREEVFEPLGMTSSRYSWDKGEEIPALAVGHSEIYSVQQKRIPYEGNAAASLHTTASDYARFLVAWLGDKRMMRAFYVPLGENKIDWGLGIGVQKTDKRTIAFQYGDNGDFKSFVTINPDDRSAIVYFTNSTNGLAICREMAAEAVGDISQAFDWLSETCGYESYDTPGYFERLQGLDAIKRGNYPEAITYFEKAIGTNSNDKKSQHYIGVIRDLIHVTDKPSIISKEVLQRYEGRYGPWGLKLEDGKLIAYFNGIKEDMLIPITGNSFILKEGFERIVVYIDDDPRIEVYLVDGNVMIDRRKSKEF